MAEQDPSAVDVTVGEKTRMDDKPPSYDAVQTEPPPSYDSIFGRIKQAKQDSSGVKEFSQSTFNIIVGSTTLVLGCIICSGIAMAVPIAMIVIGSLKLDECPAERYIPIYLIVCGVFSIVAYILSSISSRKKGQQIQQSDAEGGQSADEGGSGLTGCLGCLSCMIGPFLFAWFIAGNVWIYRIYEPNYDDVNAPDYCDKTLYLFSFWLLNVTYILIGLSCCLGICGCCTVATTKK